jgi:hypothetical protein
MRHQQYRSSSHGRSVTTLFVWLLLLLVVGSISSTTLFFSDAKSYESGNTASQPIIARDELQVFIQQATDYLVRISHTTQQDAIFPGRFTYEQNLQDPLELSAGFWNNEDNYQEDYNLLRHNGAIYSLGLSFERTPQDQVKEAMLRAVDYLKKDALHPVPDIASAQEEGGVVPQAIPNMIAAWEKTSFTDPKALPQVAKLGGAGLALIALLYTERVAQGTTPLKTLRELGNFIQYMQHPEDGSFTCKYSYKYGKNDSWNSLYYPGEAALGLTMLAELDVEKQEQWLVVATKTLLYLEQLRRNQPLDEIEPDHWALLATAKLLPLLEQYDSDVEYWLVYNHGVRVATSMVDSVTLAGLAKHQGCMSYDRRTCPTATRLEGLLAALTFIRDSEVYVGEDERVVQPLRERLEEVIEYGVKFLLDAQELSTSNLMQGGVPARYPIKNADDDANVRVDYVQHSMSAIIAYERYLLEKKSGTKLMRNGLKKLKNIRDNVAGKIHSKHHKNRGDAVIADAGTNYVLLAFIFAVIAAVVMLVYKPIFLRRQSRQSKVKRRD